MQNASTQSAKKMQLLSPHLKALQEKYKDDPVRAQQEYSKLLKEYGVNPLGGCLPLLATIPIFFGFFWMLGQAIELRGSEFFWVKDLSQPDTLFRIAGFPVNILPLVMAGTSFWQMALMPKTGDPVQQRIFMFMPLIFIAFCYNFASALSLYYTVQNLFSIFQLYVTRNQPMPKLEKVAAPAAARGGKPRKRPR
jgi:YidC/Oxa1 family membrane protein insertase